MKGWKGWVSGWPHDAGAPLHGSAIDVPLDCQVLPSGKPAFAMDRSFIMITQTDSS
jgi:hypothetical protein